MKEGRKGYMEDFGGRKGKEKKCNYIIIYVKKVGEGWRADIAAPSPRVTCFRIPFVGG